MNQADELESSFLEEYESASILAKIGKTKAALILLSKSLFALVDYIIFTKHNKLPKNHNDRFRILEEKETFIYKKVDSVWSKYTDSYKKPSSLDSLNLLKTTIKEIAEHERISEKIKNLVKKE